MIATHPSRAAGSRRALGLTILEMLVALTILGLSIALLYRSLGDSARRAGDLTERQQALLVLQGWLHTAPDRLLGPLPEQGAHGGIGWRIDPAGDAPAVSVEPLDPAAAAASGNGDTPTPIPVRITATWGDGRTVQTTTWRLPPVSQP